MSQIEEIEMSIEEAKKLVSRRDAAHRLSNNVDFKELILDGYLKDEAVRLSHLTADGAMKQHQDEIFVALQGISLFRQYMMNLIRMGDMAQNEMMDYEQALDDLRAEGDVA